LFLFVLYIFYRKTKTHTRIRRAKKRQKKFIIIKRQLRAVAVIEKENNNKRKKKDKYTVHIGGECFVVVAKIICSMNQGTFFSMD